MISAPLEKSAPSRRSRIVVNLDNEPDGAQTVAPGRGNRGAGRSGGGGGRGGGGGGGRGRRVLLIVVSLFAVLLLAVFAGLYFWWRSYQTRPNYSLALVVDAAQRGDMQTFDQLVDTDQIVDNFVPQVMEKAGAPNLSGLSTQNLPGLGGQARKQVQTLAQKYVPQIKERVREEVAAQVKEISSSAQHKPFLLVALAMPFAIETKQDGDTARVNAHFKDRPIELTMQRSGERWKIVGVKDDVLVARILENVMRDLPANAAGSQLPDDLRRKLEKKLPGKLPDIPLFTK